MHHAAVLQNEPPAPLPLRHDTILGVCQGIGEDFGFSPTWLRLAFAVMLFVQPVWTVIAYFAFGLVVACARLLAPDVRPIVVAQPIAPDVDSIQERGECQGELQLAA